MLHLAKMARNKRLTTPSIDKDKSPLEILHCSWRWKLAQTLARLATSTIADHVHTTQASNSSPGNECMSPPKET